MENMHCLQLWLDCASDPGIESCLIGREGSGQQEDPFAIELLVLH
jgi:hypothetical protein